MSFTVIRNVIGVGIALLIAWYSHGQITDFDRLRADPPKHTTNPWAKEP